MNLDEIKLKENKSNTQRQKRYQKYTKQNPLVVFRLAALSFELYQEYALDAYSLGIIPDPSVGLLARKGLEEYCERNSRRFNLEGMKRITSNNR
jgi:hypothetical protein